ncbi:hypothetical protein AAFF_G00274870 [Aldrovandia affinis]|uniref:Uncharacterized protein n=1 Tax=Aldrovandia affinis TaxID=143900 RepID=A0AAD7SRU0_9TELE|nr:hypothetical protein AAFF_G00274870 [Aldrovandia affinis]
MTLRALARNAPRGLRECLMGRLTTCRAAPKTARDHMLFGQEQTVATICTIGAPGAWRPDEMGGCPSPHAVAVAPLAQAEITRRGKKYARGQCSRYFFGRAIVAPAHGNAMGGGGRPTRNRRV